MSQPPDYERQEDFTDYQTNNPGQPMSGAELDNEFNAVKTTTDAINTNLALLQRDDTQLKNAIVHPDSFNSASLALIASDWVPKGLWVTTTIYSIGDVVEQLGKSYVAAEDHTAGTFTTDHAAGKWVILSYNDAVTQTDVSRFAVATGTADAMIAAMTPTLQSLTDGVEYDIRALGANTVTTPTADIDGLGPTTITQVGNQALSVGDIEGVDHDMILRYNATNNVLELLNPSLLNHTAKAADAHAASTISNVIQIVTNVATLRTIAPNITRNIRTAGVVSTGDNGGGDWYGLTGAGPGTYVDDIGLTVVPNGGDGSAAWRRIENGQPLDPKFFDAKGDDSTLDTAAIQAALDTARDVTFNVKGIYQCVDLRPGSNQKITIPPGVVLKQPDQSSVTGSGVITISGKSNVHILGKGEIDGNGVNNTYALHPSGWPWHGVVISSASTDCTVNGPYIYDCEEPVNGTGDCADIVIRADSKRCSVLDVRLGASNNNLMLYNAHDCTVDNVIIEDNTLSEGLSIFNDGSTLSRRNGHTISNIRFKKCRQSLAINESSGNVVTNVVSENWIDNALTVRAGGNEISNYICIAGEDTVGINPVSVTQADGGTTDIRYEETTLTAVLAEQLGHDVTSGNAFQISNGKEFPVTLIGCKAKNSIAEWEVTTAYTLDYLIQPTILDGYYYKCTTAGTSGGTEPTFGAGTTNDGTAVWTRQIPNSNSGFNINASKDIKLIGCESDNMFGSGYKVQSGSEYIDFVNCDATRNREYGLLVNASSLSYGQIKGGKYNNNGQGGGSNAGILVNGTGNLGVNIDQEVQAIDDQEVPTQATNGISVGADTGNLVSSSAPPKRGIWNLGQQVFRRNPSGSAHGWYVFGRTDTTVNATEATGQTVITVTSIAGIANNDTIGIWLDDGTWHWTTVNGAPAGTEVTITDALPSGTSAGKRVVTHEWVGF